MFCPQIKLRAEHPCAIRLAPQSLPAQMAMRIKFYPQIINHIWFRGFFSCSGRVCICAPNIRCANKLARYKYESLVWSASPNFKLNRLFILLERAETEIHFALANGMFKMKMDIDRHGPRPMPNICKNLNPPNFSLPSTFKMLISLLHTDSKLVHSAVVNSCR